jgi:homoserine kinase type II
MAVYTEVGDEDLVQFTANYDIGEVLSCKGIAEGIENSNFALSTTAGNFILTLYEKRVDPNDLPFFLGLMDHLAEAGIPCPTPIHGRDGEALRRLCGRPAAIVTFLSGMWPRRISPDHCAELGRSLAEMHQAGADFKMSRANDLSLESWRPLLAKSEARADEVESGLAKELASALDALEAGWPTGLATGVIHADLFPDNVFFRDGKLSGMIDFYFACTDMFAYDLGVCLNAWCFEPDRSFNVTKAKRLLTAYRKVRDFSAEELEALPLLAQGSAIRFLLTRLYDWLNTPGDAMVTRKDPLEFLAKLRFHLGVKGPADYGLD